MDMARLQLHFAKDDHAHISTLKHPVPVPGTRTVDTQNVGVSRTYAHALIWGAFTGDFPGDLLLRKMLVRAWADIPRVPGNFL